MSEELNDLEDAWDKDLKPKERLYVLHFCTDEESFLNGKESYRRAYTKKDRATGERIEPTAETCEVNASRLMRKEKVKMAIRKLLKVTQADLDEKNVYRIINNLANLAFFNPADVIKANGSLVTDDLRELGDNAKAIAQITPTLYGAKVTLIDRAKYIDLMMRYLNIVRPEQQIEIKLPVVEMQPKAESIEAWNAMAEKEE